MKFVVYTDRETGSKIIVQKKHEVKARQMLFGEGLHNRNLYSRHVVKGTFINTDGFDGTVYIDWKRV